MNRYRFFAYLKGHETRETFLGTPPTSQGRAIAFATALEWKNQFGTEVVKWGFGIEGETPTVFGGPARDDYT